ncbi:MAG TPA: LysM peptidoglycan-binding domain-containing protein [Chromatiales bacterium]|nr:LysM peptidoglycan-binding domain-containing protein [Thiotrichales bacterium]HIP67085.1 LysM peptidoglycan-binding domain-containing protein [Chromatiales bacterium]
MKKRPHSLNRRQFIQLLTSTAGAGLLLPAFSFSYAAGWVRVTHARIEQEPGKTRLLLNLDGSAEHNLFMLKKPERVVIDLPNTALAKGVNFNQKLKQPVNRIRHAIRNNSGLRIVLDVSRPGLQVRSFKNKSGSAAQQLVIELVDEKLAASAPVKTVKQAAQKKRDLIIAIDAGHGGKDPGAIGKKGTKEKDIVLKIARELETLIKREPGLKPVLIRDGDYFIPLRDRIKKARKHQADLFISVHADAARNRKARGSSVFVLSQNGASSEAARWLAKKENNADLIGGISLDEKDPMLASVLLDLSQRHTNESSSTVAGSLLQELKKVGEVHSRKVERAGFVVLKSPDIPSVLVESAFLSNPREEKKLRTREYQQRVAKAVLKGVKKYFVNNAPQDSLFASLRSQEHTIQAGDTLSGIAHRYQVSLSHLRASNNLKSDRLRVGQVLKIPVSDT